MSVFRRPQSKYWQFEFQIQGRIFAGSTKCTDKNAAKDHEKAEREKAEQLLDNMTKTRRQPMTVGDALPRWWRERGSQMSTAADEWRLDRLVEQLGRDTMLQDITDNAVSLMVFARRQDTVFAGKDDKGKQLRRPISNATVNKSVDLLRRVMRHARDSWDVVILREPNWRKHMLPVSKRPVREITRAEEDRLDRVECADYAALRRFAILYGLRRREVLLTWPQVDFDEGVFRIVAKGKKPRIYPITHEALAILWPRRGHHETQVFTFVAKRTRRCPHHGTEQIKGERYPITYHGFSSRKQRAWAAAGVDARIHDMRHTTGMRTLRTTRNLRTTQKLLGHAKINTTADFYTDANLEDLRNALDETAAAYERPPLEQAPPKLLPKPGKAD